MPRTAKTKSVGGGQVLSETEISILEHYLEVVENNQVRITKNLDRDLYERLKQIFEHLGGVYLPGRKRFEFALDPSPLIAQTIVLGQMPKENPLDFYYSPPNVVESLFIQLEWGDTMCDLLRDSEHSGRPIRMIEPNAGLGHLADAFRARYPMATIDVCELDPYRRAILQAKEYRVVAEDFLQYHPSPDCYDVILMNPAFTVGGDPFTFIKHITHAESMLSSSPWSKLVSVVPAQFSHVERYQKFYIHVLQYGEYEPLEQGSFVEAGTKWETAVVSLSRRKNHFYANWDSANLEDGYPNQRLKEAWMYISVDEQLSTAQKSLLRNMVEGKLVVYNNGCAAPETQVRIRAFCQQITHRLLYEYRLYVPFTPQDEQFMEQHILNDYQREREQYGGMRGMEWEQERLRKHGALQDRVEKAEARLQYYRKETTTQERLLAQYRSTLEAFETAAEQCPEFLPAVEPPPPEHALPPGEADSPQQERPSESPPVVQQRTPVRSRYRQLAFF
ncbi:MAG: hypothetical protein H0U76_22410 [Ktedonobacteraceae bacterium]|nr:hypothetical protein [Ktedonobacteraceae bacterium]